MGFAGKRVLSLESRRNAETAELIRRQEGEPFVAPSMREVPIERNEEVFNFAERLLRGEFEMVIFLTGVGTRYLMKVIETRHPVPEFSEALKKIITVARGPKPAAALREFGIQATIFVPEPNTWRETLQAIEGRTERRVAVQEYGRPASELIDGLKARGFEVTSVPVYVYDLPDDIEPLREAVTQLAQGGFEVTLWTTSQQVVHLLEIARQMELEEEVVAGIRKGVICSIGPTTSEALREHGFEPDLEPSHPKLGVLVKEAAERADDLLWTKKL